MRPVRSILGYLLTVPVLVACGNARPVDGATDVEKSATASTEARDDGRATWTPPGSLARGRVVDLCTDEGAEKAGLDGRDLAKDRLNLGVVCTGETASLAVINYWGEPELLPDNDGDGRPDATEDQIAVMAAVPSGLGIDLGHRYHSLRLGADLQGDETSVPSDLLQLTDAHEVCGIVVNTQSSGPTKATVKIQSEKFDSSQDIPFVLQTGERAPFCVEVPDDTTDLSEVSVRAILAQAPTDALAARRLLVVDAPGYWEGVAKDLPDGPPGLYDQVESDDELVRMYQTMIEIDPGQSGLDAVISSPQALLAELDSTGRVIRVVPSTVFGADSDFRKRSESISPGDGAIVGIVLSETATDVAMWVYGA